MLLSSIVAHLSHPSSYALAGGYGEEGDLKTNQKGDALRATDKKKHFIYHLLVIFKANGDANNAEPGWCEYTEEEEE